MFEREAWWTQYQKRVVASGSTPEAAERHVANLRACHLPPPGAPGNISFTEYLASQEATADSRVVVRGRKSARRGEAAYVASLPPEETPLEARLKRTGHYDVVVKRLQQLVGRVKRGQTLTENFADGSRDGWVLRQALATRLAYGDNVVDWDKRSTKRERLALVESLLEALGASLTPPARRGGWAVSGRRVA